MKKKILLGSSLVAVVATVIVSCSGGETSSTGGGPVSNDSLVKKGEYLVSVMGCDDCHSPKKMGARGPEIIPELRLSGYPSDRPITKTDTSVLKSGWLLFAPDLTSAIGPWGRSFSANISSDTTGIGNWTEENFSKAIREGKWKGLDNTRMLLPPMPWQDFARLKDDDVKAIFAFLKSTKPVKNIVPAPKSPAEL